MCSCVIKHTLSLLTLIHGISLSDFCDNTIILVRNGWHNTSGLTTILPLTRMATPQSKEECYSPLHPMYELFTFDKASLGWQWNFSQVIECGFSCFVHFGFMHEIPAASNSNSNNTSTTGGTIPPPSGARPHFASNCKRYRRRRRRLNISPRLRRQTRDKGAPLQ